MWVARATTDQRFCLEGQLPIFAPDRSATSLALAHLVQTLRTKDRGRANPRAADKIGSPAAAANQATQSGYVLRAMRECSERGVHGVDQRAGARIH